MHDCLVLDYWWGDRNLKSSTFWFQPVWGLVFVLSRQSPSLLPKFTWIGVFLVSAEQLKDMHQIVVYPLRKNSDCFITEYCLSYHLFSCWTVLPLFLNSLTSLISNCLRCFGFPRQAKNLPANAGDTETWVPFLSQKDPLEEEMATHTRILAWGNPMNRRVWWATSMGSQRVRHNWANR